MAPIRDLLLALGALPGVLAGPALGARGYPVSTHQSYPETTTALPEYPTTCPAPSTVTVTETETTTATAMPSCEPTVPPLSCDKYGYLIQYSELVRVDLATGGFESVRDNIGDASAINAIAYHPIDNFLYARQSGKNQLIRIASDGSSSIVATLPSTIGAIIGDIDEEGYYWYASHNAEEWVKLDLRPGSATYAQEVESGKTPDIGRTAADWVHVPIAGPYMWSVGGNPAGGVSLIRWSLNTHKWEIVANYRNVEGGFGALYGINNGTIFASDNGSGRIWAFSVNGDGTRPYVASNGPPSGSNDGARCVSNLEI